MSIAELFANQLERHYRQQQHLRDLEVLQGRAEIMYHVTMNGAYHGE